MYVNDEPVAGTITVNKDDTVPFYVEVDSGYELVSVTSGTKESVLDVWDGSSVNSGWYAPDLTSHTITTAAELAGVKYLVRNGLATFQGITLYLGADLDMTGGEWSSIGGNDGCFMGTFDGQGHTVIVNISEAGPYGSFFGLTDGATIRNLTLAGNISGGYPVAAFVAKANNTAIENCVNLASVSGTGSAAGFVCSVKDNLSTVVISDCYNGGAITGGSGAAGIVSASGYDAYITILRCQNGGTITAGEAAGIIYVAFEKASIDQCSNIGTIIGGNGAGGIVRYLYGAVTNSCNLGSVRISGDYSSTSGVGGIAASASNAAIVQNCYNAGTVSSINGGSAVGSFIGAIRQGNMINYFNNYWLDDGIMEGVGVTNNTYSERQIRGVTSEELKACYSALGDGLWHQDTTGVNDGYPVLRNSPAIGIESALTDMGGGEYMVTDIRSDVNVRIVAACVHDYVEDRHHRAHLHRARRSGLPLFPLRRDLYGRSAAARP